MGTTRRPRPAKSRPRIDSLAKATFAAWSPYINIHDPGVKVSVCDPVTGEVDSTVVHAISRELRDNFFKDRRGEYVSGFYASFYHARVYSARKTENHIRGLETHYYTSGRAGLAVVYLDTDAHRPHQVPDVPGAVELIERLVPGTFGRESARGWNHYLKVRYGGQVAQYNRLTDRLQAAVRVLFRANRISCDFETKGTITTPQKAGRLAKLPFANWTQEDLRRWVETPTLMLPEYRALVERLEQVAAERVVEVVEPVVTHRSAADVRTRAADRHDQEADRFRANIRHVMAFARRIRRVPGVGEALEHLRENNLFTGRWEDGEARREARVQYILDHFVEPKFDPQKCGKQFPVEALKGLVEKYRHWAERKYGDRTLVMVGGRVVELDPETLGTYLAICHFCLDVDPHRGDGGIPYRRVMECWNALYERKLVSAPWVRSIYTKCRTFLDANEIVAITDRSYGPDRSMRYGKGDQFPDHRYRARQDVQSAPGQMATVRRFPTPNNTQHPLNLCVSTVSCGWRESGPDPPD